MKTNQFPMAFALAAVILFGGAMTCTAQNYNNQNQKFGLTTALASGLALTTSQIDSASKNLLILNYDWNEAVNSTLLLDQQIATLENDTNQSPTAIGLAAGSLIQQKVTIARSIIAEVLTSNKTLLATLTASQQQKLAAIQNAVSAQNASNIYTLNSDAFFGNLFVGQYSVIGFDPNNSNMTYPTTPPQATNTALGQMFTAAVEEGRAQLTKDRAAAARRTRMIPLEGER